MNLPTWQDLCHSRSIWRLTVNTKTAIHEANRIGAAKAGNATRKFQLLDDDNGGYRYFHPDHRKYTPDALQPLITATTTSNADSIRDFPACNRTFTSCIGLICHLQIHHTETAEPVPETTEYTRRTRLSCLHYPLIFSRRIGLPGLIHAEDS
nr:unnamed protein product [Spirometra erinaceieuropaei]